VFSLKEKFTFLDGLKKSNMQEAFHHQALLSVKHKLFYDVAFTCHLS